MQLTRNYTLYYIVILASLCAFTLPLSSMSNFMNNLEKQLVAAIEAGNVQQVQTLITEQHANVNFKYGKYTPLAHAIAINNEKILTLLLESGADPTVKIADNTPDALCLAVQCQNKDIVQILINATPVQNNWQTLFSAIKCNNKDIVQMLIDAGINVNLTESNNFTALMVATYDGSLELIKLLLAADADFSLESNKQHTAFTVARQLYINCVFSSYKRHYQKIGKTLLDAYIAQKDLRNTLKALTRYFLEQQLPENVIELIFSFKPVFFTKYDKLISAQHRCQQLKRTAWNLNSRQTKCSIQ